MKISKPRSQRYTTKEPALHFSTFPANEDIENFQMSFSLIFQFKESQFLLRIVAEYIGDVIFVWSAPQKLQKKGSVNIFVTGDDRKEPLRYKEPLLHTVSGLYNTVQQCILLLQTSHDLTPLSPTQMLSTPSVFFFHPDPNLTLFLKAKSKGGSSLQQPIALRYFYDLEERVV